MHNCQNKYCSARLGIGSFTVLGKCLACTTFPELGFYADPWDFLLGQNLCTSQKGDQKRQVCKRQTIYRPGTTVRWKEDRMRHGDSS